MESADSGPGDAHDGAVSRARLVRAAIRENRFAIALMVFCALWFLGVALLFGRGGGF